jgi:hypothetical protein
MVVGGDAITVTESGVGTTGGIGDGVSTAAVGGVSVGTTLGTGELPTVDVGIFCLPAPTAQAVSERQTDKINIRHAY